MSFHRLCKCCFFIVVVVVYPSPPRPQALVQEVAARQPDYDKVFSKGKHILQLAHPRAVPILESKLQQLERKWLDLRGKLGKSCPVSSTCPTVLCCVLCPTVMGTLVCPIHLPCPVLCVLYPGSVISIVKALAPRVTLAIRMQTYYAPGPSPSPRP